MEDDHKIGLMQNLVRLPLGQKFYLGLALATTFGAGAWFGQELNKYIVGMKEIELYNLRNELGEARDSLEAISTTAALASDGGILAETAEPTAVAVSTPIAKTLMAAATTCVSKQLRLLGFYEGAIGGELTADLLAASERYRTYMAGKEAGWRQPALDANNASFWCDRVADAFANTRPYLDELNAFVAAK